MKFKDIKSTPKDELKSKLIELKKELIKDHAQIATGTTPKSPGQVKQVKKNIAKIQMALSQLPKKQKEE